MADNDSESATRQDKIIEAHRDLERVVTELDDIQLHHAAAHVSTALDILRAGHPGLLTSD